MTHYFSLQSRTLWQLFLRSVKVTSPGLKDKIINNLVWSMLNIVVFTFIMPAIGISNNYGAFIAATMPISCAFFVSISATYVLLTDISSDGSNLQYELTLPINQWMIFARYAMENAYQAICSAILILPIGKLILWNNFSFAHFSFLKYYFLLLMVSLFSGFFSIFVVSITKDMYSGLDNMWTRIVFPMWFLGGFQFSWYTLHEVSPVLAYIGLLNPLTYALEGGRAAALDPAKSLPYWPCIFALLMFTTIFGYLGISNLKKRLDCL